MKNAYLKNGLLLVVLLQLGSLASAQTRVQFNKARCQQVMPAGFSALCDLHEEQMASRSFRADAVSGFSYTMCNKFTGELSRHSSGAVPCVSYFVESELKKEIVLKSIFGLTPKYPLSYKGLLINFSLYQPQAQYGSPTSSGQMGDSSKVRQYGYSPKTSNTQMGDNQNSGGVQQMQ